jgi:ribosome-binding protein aMBF1 (putative translation factor)
MPISISPEVHRQRKVEQATILKPKSLSGESRIQISKARSEKKITQNDLNIHCSFPKNTIRDVESGKITPSSVQLRIINARLGLNLKLE